MPKLPIPSNRTVTWSLFATGAVVLVASAARGSWPDPRRFIALAVLFVILGFGAELAPQLASAFAVLVFVAVLLYEGTDALEGTIRAVGGKPKRKQGR